MGTMLSCLCSTCTSNLFQKRSSAAERWVKSVPASLPATTSAALLDLNAAGKNSSDNALADHATRPLSMGPETARGDTPLRPVFTTNTDCVPISSPFVTSERIRNADAESGSAIQNAGTQTLQLPHESPAATAAGGTPKPQGPADGSKISFSTFASSPSPALCNQLASISSSCDPNPPSQSQTQQTSLPTGTSTSTLSLQPPSLHLNQLFLIQQATSSPQSVGGAANPPTSLLVLPPNNTSIHIGHFSTGATVRSEAGTEATIRLPGELSAAVSPAALLVSEASTTRFVEYLTHESSDIGVATASATGNSGNLARQLGTGALPSIGSATSPRAVTSCAGSRKAEIMPRPAASSISGAGSGFSLFGALQAFVDQRRGGDAAAPASGNNMMGGAPHGQVQVPGTPSTGDHFHGFDRGAFGGTGQDAPTATLTRVRTASPQGACPQARPACEKSRARRRGTAGDEGAGTLPQSALVQGPGSRGDGVIGRRSNEWSRAQTGSGAEFAVGQHAGDHPLPETGIIIGGAYVGSNSSSINAVVAVPAAVQGPPRALPDEKAADLAVAAVLTRASVASNTGDEAMGLLSWGRPLSGLHSFDGMASLLGGPTHASFLDETCKGSAGHPAAGAAFTGSETDGSRTDNAGALISGSAALRGGGGGNGGGDNSRVVRMQRRAERREFLSAARSINNVLQDVQILSVLGAGAHGRVYKGALRDRFVAVKVIIHDADAAPVIPVSSLTGLGRIPSTASLVGVNASGGLPTDSRPAVASGMAMDPGAPAASPPSLPMGPHSAFARVGLDASQGYNPEAMPLIPGSASGSGGRPAVHMLRYQRSGSSGMHALPLASPCGGGGGGSVVDVSQVAGASGLPLLSLPGMPPIVMPHKHMLEGLISASAQHPNIVETYRIVTQLLSAPSMPAFVVTRGSQSPLWETTNLTPTAVLRFGNSSLGGGQRGPVDGGGTLGAGVAMASAAGADSGLAPGAAQNQAQGVGGVSSGTAAGAHAVMNRMRRVNGVPPSPLSASSLSQAGPVVDTAEGPAEGSSAVDLNCSLPGFRPRSESGNSGPECLPGGSPKGAIAVAVTSDAGRAGGPTAWDLPKLASRVAASLQPDTPSSSGIVDSRGRTSQGGVSGCPVARSGAPSRAGADGAMMDAQLVGREATPSSASSTAGAVPQLQMQSAVQRNSLLSADVVEARLSLAGASRAPQGAVDTGPCSASAATFRGSSALSVATLMLAEGLYGHRMSGSGAALGQRDSVKKGEDGPPAGTPHSSGHGLLGPGRTSSSSGIITGQAVTTTATLVQPEGSFPNACGPSPCLSTCATIVSASGLAHGDPESESPEDFALVQPHGFGSSQATETAAGSGNAVSLAAAGIGGEAELPLSLPGAKRWQAAAQRGDLHPEMVEGEGVAAAAGLVQDKGQPGGDAQDGADAQEVDSAEMILDLLGAQAAAQRTASFLQRLKQQQQQQANLDGGNEAVSPAHQDAQALQRSASPHALVPGQPEPAPWCQPLGGGEEDIVGFPRNRPAGTHSGSVRGGAAAAVGSPKAFGGTREIASGSGPSSNAGGGVDSPLYDYLMADDSGQMLPHVEQFALSTALFSSYRYSFAPTDFGSVSGRPTYRMPYLRGSHSSIGGAVFSLAGTSRPQLGSLAGGGGGPEGRDAIPLHAGPAPAGLLQVESTSSASSLHVVEASLALPPPLQAPAAVLQSTLHSPNAIGSGPVPAASAWLPTIDELTAGVSPDAPLQSANIGALITYRDSTGSGARYPLHHTISASSGSGEQASSGISGDTGAGVAAAAATGTHRTRSSNSSGGSTHNRSLLISNTHSNFGGQLMPAEVQYDKMSWSNHTHTSASTSANTMLNSGFTALLSSLNMPMTGGVSNPSGGGGIGVVVSGLAGFRRTANTATGTETSIANYGEKADAPGASAGSGADDVGSGRGGTTSSYTKGPSHDGNGGGNRELRPAPVTMETLSRSITDPRSSRGTMGPRRRAVTVAKAGLGGTGLAPGRERWQVLIVQELCTRGNLRDAITSGAFHFSNASAGTQVIAMRQLLDTAAEIASAMAYLHSRAIVHGDLKTANVLLQRQDSDPRGFIAKLGDFGLARPLGSRGAEDGLLVSRIGTVTHMAPETIRDNMVLLASDVYSFGVIMWELYCAQQPFANYSAFQLLSAVVQYDERPRFPVHCPTAYAALAVRCMAKDPRGRPTFDEVHKELIAIRDELFGGSSSSSSGPGQISCPGGTIMVPLAQARKEVARVLQSHLQMMSGTAQSISSGPGSSILRVEATQDSDAASGPLSLQLPLPLPDGPPGGQPDSATGHSSRESWDVYSRMEGRNG